jgi:hypothetical protein
MAKVDSHGHSAQRILALEDGSPRTIHELAVGLQPICVIVYANLKSIGSREAPHP